MSLGRVGFWVGFATAVCVGCGAAERNASEGTGGAPNTGGVPPGSGGAPLAGAMSRGGTSTGGFAFVRGIEHNYVRAISGGLEVRRLQRAFMVIRKEGDGKWRFARGMTNLPPEESPAIAEAAPA